jgi:glycosyltransferase involved in cell wall biosynthesis
MKRNISDIDPPRVAFVFDRVMHYHLDLFRQLEERLRNRGIELHLYSGAKPSRETGRVAVQTQVIPSEQKFQLRDRKVGTFILRLALGYLGPIRRLHPDVVICPAHPGDLGHWGLILMKSLSKYRLLAWQCGYEYNPGRLKRWLLKHFVPSFDFHLAYHSNARHYALENGAREDQVEVTHNTINEAKFVITDKQAALAAIRQLHPEIGERRIVLYVGAVLKEKKLERVLEAMTGLARPDAMLLIVGDGPHLPALRGIATGRNDVVFAGQVIEGVGIYFDAAEVYVLPGTGGLGINEAMAHSLPIISGYADGSADDLVVDGVNGYRLREDTVEELADRIGKILDQPEMTAKMGRISREWITGKFSFQRFLDRVESALLRQIEVKN